MLEVIAHSCSYTDLARAKSEALFNIYSLLKQNLKPCNRPLKLVCFVFPNKGPREFHSLSFHNLCVYMHINKTKFERNRSLEYYHMTCIQTYSFARAAHFFRSFPCRCFARLKREISRNFLVTHFMKEMFVFLFTLVFHCR